MPLTDTYVPSPGLGQSSVLNQLGSNVRLPTTDWVNVRRPYLDDRGRIWVDLHDRKGGFTRNDSHGGVKRPIIKPYMAADLMYKGFKVPSFVMNATTMRKEDWIQLDMGVLRAARQELRATMDLEAAVPYGGFDAIGKMTLEYQAMSDVGRAYVDMTATTDGTNDTPTYILRSLPLPIVHSDFGFADRELAVSRNSDTPLDTTMGEMAGRRVAEMVEDIVIGNETGVTYGTQTAGPGTHTGTSTVYGFTNFAERLTKTNFTAPTAGGWTAETTFNEVLAALQQLLNQYFRGPFVVYHSRDWFQYMNRNFSVAGGNNAGETLRSMLLKIPNISDVRILERLTSTFTFVFVQMTPDVVQLVNGREITTVQWQEKGGLELRFKVLAIKVPRLRSDFNSRTGILHGTTA